MGEAPFSLRRATTGGEAGHRLLRPLGGHEDMVVMERRDDVGADPLGREGNRDRRGEADGLEAGMHRQDDAPEGGQALEPQAPGLVGAQNDGRALRLVEDHQRVVPLRQRHGQGREDIQRRVEVRRELRQQAPEIALAAHPRGSNCRPA